MLLGGDRRKRQEKEGGHPIKGEQKSKIDFFCFKLGCGHVCQVGRNFCFFLEAC